MPKAPAQKKTPNNQHDIRGASFLRIAKRLRANSRIANVNTMAPEELLLLIVEALESEALTVRRLR